MTERASSGPVRRRAWLVLAACLAAGFSFIGSRWGLANPPRLDLLLGDGREAVLEEIVRLTSERGFKKNLHVYDREQNPVDAPYASAIRRISIADDRDELFRIYRHYLFWSETGDVSTVFGPISTMRPDRWDFNPHSFQYGGAFLYPIAACLKLFDSLGLVRVVNDASFYILNPEEFVKLAWVGRGFVAAMFALCALLVFKAGETWGGPFTGVLSAILFLFMPGAIATARDMKPHGVGTAWVVLSFYTALLFLRNGKLRHLALSSVAAGLAAGTALNYGVTGLFPAMAVWFRRSSVGPRHLLVVAGGAAAAFVATNPYFLFNLDIVRSEADYHRSVYFQAGTSHWFGGALRAMSQAVSWPLGLWFLGSAVACFSGDRAARSEILLASIPPLAYAALLYVYTRGLVPTRVTAYLLPFIALISARGLSTLLRKRTFARAALAAIVIGASGASAFAWLRHYRQNERGHDSLHRAGEWLNGLPKGVSVGCWGPPEPGAFPPMRFLDHPLVTFPRSRPDARFPAEQAPDYFVSRKPSPPLSDAYVLHRTFDNRRRWELWLFPHGSETGYLDAPVYVFKKTAATS